MATNPKDVEAEVARFNRESWELEPESSPQAIVGAPEERQALLPGEEGYVYADGTTQYPFQEDQSSPFGDMANIEAEPASNRPTPLRVLTAATAMVGENGQPEPQSQDELVAMIEQNIDLAEKLIQDGQERQLQLQSSVRQTERRIAALRNTPRDQLLPGGELISDQLYADIQETVAADRIQRIQETAEADLVEEAITKLQTYLAAGDTVAARALINRMDPTKNTTFGVIHENLKKAAIIAQAVERAELDEAEEGFVNSVVTAITSVPEVILLGDMFQKLGNVDPEKYDQQSAWWRFLWPGDDYAEQINAVQSMSSEELSEYMPTLIENVRNNATTLGLTDRGTVVRLLSDFQNGVTEEAKAMGHAFHWLDVAALVPFTGLVRGAKRTSELFMGIGVRKQAADRVANAINVTMQGGDAAAVRRFGITGDEIVEHSLPSAINPGRMSNDFSFGARAKTKLKAGTAAVIDAPRIPRVSVSLSGDISDTMAIAREVNERLRTKYSTVRLTPEELEVAVRHEIKEVEARVGSKIADFTVNRIKLESGQEIAQLDIIVNQPFATADEAAGFLRDAGYGADITSAEQKFVGTGTRPERAYHGTTEAFDTFDTSKTFIGEKAGWFTSNPDVANTYTKKSSGGSPNIRPVNVDTSNLLEVDMGGAKFGAKTLVKMDTAMKKAMAEGKDGVVFRNVDDAIRSGQHDPSDVFALFDPDKTAKSGFGEVVEDVSGQFFPRVTVDVSETGFFTNPLNVPHQLYPSRWVLNPSQTSDVRLFEQATKSGQLRQRLLKAVNRDLIKAFQKLSRNERMFLDQVLLKGANMKKWFKDGEFRTIWERATGRVPPDHVEAAYRQYKINNDFEWLMRNAEVRASYVTRGFEDVRFNAMGHDVEQMGRLVLEPKVSKSRLYNVSDDSHWKPGELTQDQLDDFIAKGYVVVDTEDLVRLKDGTEIDRFLIKKSELETNPVRQNILEYVEGGHRLYAHKNFIKQARRFKQPDDPSASAILKRPNVFATAPTMQEARLWSETMNLARRAVLENKADAKFLDEQIFKGQRLSFPTGEEFLKGVDDGTYQLDEPFEALFDRELPSAYSKTPGAANKFADEEEPGFGGYYRTTGRLYYSKKGDHLRAVDGELSPTVDPFQAQSSALYNITQLTSFADFKTSAIHRWANTYQDMLVYRAGADPVEIFNESTLSRNINPSLAAQIEGQRESIQRVLNFRSDFDRHWQNWLRTMHEWIAGTSDNAFRRELSKAPLYLLDRNPIAYLRGWAFDLKLGLFNIGQFFLQTSTMFSAAALAGWSKAMHGFGSLPAVRAYHGAKGLGTQENVLDVMAKRGFGKLAGFKSEEEFKAYVRFVADSGFLDFGDTHALINASNPASTFAITSKTQAFREMGRKIFYEAEIWNRIMGMRIAYDEAVEKFGKRGFDDVEFEEFVRGRAENYSFNMSETSRATWQQGLLSVPTQFWAYNFRMMEALVGKNFTRQQKLRLGLMQLGMAGAAGLPLLGAVTDYYNQSEGEAPTMESDATAATLQRGLLDRLLYEVFEVDAQAGARWGTGDFWHENFPPGAVLAELMGISQYGPQKFDEVAGGATYSIMGEVLGSAWAVGSYWMTHESGGNDVNLSRFEMETLLRQVSTINNVAYKAWFAHQYGIYQSMKGETLVRDLPPASASFIALGIAPGELRDREAIQAWTKDRTASIKESADFINRLWEESLREPDKMETNARMVNEFVNMIPEAHRTEVLRRVHLDRDPSDYDRLLRLRQKNQIIDNFAKEEGTEE